MPISYLTVAIRCGAVTFYVLRSSPHVPIRLTSNRLGHSELARLTPSIAHKSLSILISRPPHPTPGIDAHLAPPIAHKSIRGQASQAGDRERQGRRSGTGSGRPDADPPGDRAARQAVRIGESVTVVVTTRIRWVADTYWCASPSSLESPRGGPCPAGDDSRECLNRASGLAGRSVHHGEPYEHQRFEV